MDAAMLKAEILAHYRERAPRRFFQFDAFADGDEIMGRDEDGQSVTGGDTFELMHGADVRVLIPANGTQPAPELSKMLRKVADWIDRGGVEAIKKMGEGA